MTLTSSCRGYLVVIKNGESISQIPVTSENWYIGRGSECDVRLRDQHVNDKHCLIKISSYKKVTIHSVYPENPVLLNNVPVNTDGATVNHDDIIQILDNTFKWKTAEQESANLIEYRNSCQIPQNQLSENIVPIRFSAPDLVYEVDRENVDPGPRPEIIVTPPEDNPLLDSSGVKKLTSSCTVNRSSAIKHEITKRVSNTCMKDVNRVRRSRLFSKTFKATKSETNTPEKDKSTTALRVPHGSVSTPSKEVNKTPSKEVKSRHEFKRSSMRKSSLCLFRKSVHDETTLENTISENVLLENGKVDMKNENEDTDRKNMRLGNMDSNADRTFETTIPYNTNENESILPTPKRFTSAYHSTPKPVHIDHEFISNSEENLQSVHSVVLPVDTVSFDRHNETTKLYDHDIKSISASPVKPVGISNFKDSSQISDNDDELCSSKSKSKKKESEISRSTLETSVEFPRNTRGRSNLLMKTLEEHNEDNMASNERSLTTPEKTSTENHSTNAPTEETEFESCSPEKKLESTPELSTDDANGASSQDENRDKSLKTDDSGVRRNLSYISPPENNRSQEFMDSVVSTPKKLSMGDEDEQVPDLLSKVSAVENVSVSTPKSLARNRRSTGVVPCVGTPSDVYRTKKSILTPANRSRFNRTSMEVEVSMGPRDSLSGLVKSGKYLSRIRSSERKSTPLKSDKSVVRDSLQLHSPIIEDYSMENEEGEESEDDSSNIDPKYRFVSRRRRRLGVASFAAENRIMEESETNQSELTSDVENVEEEESLMLLSSFDDENSNLMSTRIVVNPDSNAVDGDSTNDRFSKLDSDDHESDVDRRDASVAVKNSMLLKSILTPLPKQNSVMKEKSAKKVTFMDAQQNGESCNDTMSSAYSVMTSDSAFDSKLTCSSVNTLNDTSDSNVEDVNETQVDYEDDEKLYVPDQSSSNVYSESSVMSSSGTKRGKVVKRLSSARKALTPHLSGVKRLLTTPKSPKSDYMNVSGIKKLMETPETIAKLLNKPDKTASKIEESMATVPLSVPSVNEEDTEVFPECNSTSVGSKANDSVFLTPLTRRCSKHFRIHRTSVCQTMTSSLNSTVQENNPLDCSASLTSSPVENEVAEYDTVAAAPLTPNTMFNSVVIELKEKLLKLQSKERMDFDAKGDDVNEEEINEDNESAITAMTSVQEPSVEEELKDYPSQSGDLAAIQDTTKNDLSRTSQEENSLPVQDKAINTQIDEKSDNSVIQKEPSLVEHSAATNDTFKTCSPVSNSTFLVEMEELSKIHTNQETDTSCITQEIEKGSRFFAMPISPVTSCENTNDLNEKTETQLNVTFEIKPGEQNEKASSSDDNVDESPESCKDRTVTISEIQDSDSDSDDVFHDSLTSPERLDNEVNESQKEENTSFEGGPSFEDSQGSTEQSLDTISDSKIDECEEETSATQTSSVSESEIVENVEQPTATFEMSSGHELVSNRKSAADVFEKKIVNEKSVLENDETSDSEFDKYEEQTSTVQASTPDSIIVENVKQSTVSLDASISSIEELLSNRKSATDIFENMVSDEQAISDSVITSENSGATECAPPNIEKVDDTVEQLTVKRTSSPERVTDAAEKSVVKTVTPSPEKMNDFVDQSVVSVTPGPGKVTDVVEQPEKKSPTPTPENATDADELTEVNAATSSPEEVSDVEESVPISAISNDEVRNEISISQQSLNSPTPIPNNGNGDQSALRSASPAANVDNVDQLTTTSSPHISKTIKPVTSEEQVVPKTPKPTFKDTDNVNQLVPSTPFTCEEQTTSCTRVISPKNDEAIEQVTVANNLISDSKTEDVSMQLQLSPSKYSEIQDLVISPTSHSNVEESVKASNHIPEIVITEATFMQEKEKSPLHDSISSTQQNEIVVENNTNEHLVTETEHVIKKAHEKADYDHVSSNVESAESVDELIEMALSPESVEISEDAENIVNEANPITVGDSEFSDSVQVTTSSLPESQKEMFLHEGEVPNEETSSKSDENAETLAVSPPRSPNYAVEMKTPSPASISKLRSIDTNNVVNNVEISGRKLSILLQDIQKMSSPKGMSTGDTTSKKGHKARNGESARAGDGSREPQSEVRKSARKKLLKDQGIIDLESVQSELPDESENRNASPSVTSIVTVDLKRIDASEDIKNTRSNRSKTVQFKGTKRQLEMKPSNRTKKNDKVRAPTPRKPAASDVENKVNPKRVVPRPEDEDEVQSSSPPKRTRTVEHLISPCSIVLKPIKNLNTKANVAVDDTDAAATVVAKGKRGYNTRRGKMVASNENFAEDGPESPSNKENAIVHYGAKPSRKAKPKTETHAIEEKRSRRMAKVEEVKSAGEWETVAAKKPAKRGLVDQAESGTDVGRMTTRHAKTQPAEIKKSTRRAVKVADEESAAQGSACKETTQPAETVQPARNTRYGTQVADEKVARVAKRTILKESAKHKKSEDEMSSGSDEEAPPPPVEKALPAKRTNSRQKTAQKKSDDVSAERETAGTARVTRSRNENKEVAAAKSESKAKAEKASSAASIIAGTSNARSMRTRKKEEPAAAKTSSSSETKGSQNLSDSMTVTVVRADVSKIVAKKRSMSSEDESSNEETTKKRIKISEQSSNAARGTRLRKAVAEQKDAGKGKRTTAKSVRKAKSVKSSEKNESNSSDESSAEVVPKESRSRKAAVKKVEESRPSPKNAKTVANHRNAKQTKEPVTRRTKKASPAEKVSSPVSRVTRSRNPSACSTRSRTMKK